MQERDAGTSVGIVLDRVDARRHAVFITAEIDQAVHALVPAAAVPSRDLALVVAAAFAALVLHQPLFGLGAVGQLGEVANAGAAAAFGGRLVASDSHVQFLDSQHVGLTPRRSPSPLEEIDLV